MKRILVLTDHMPWGHRSIARAIYGFLKKREREANLKVFYAEVRAETGVDGDIYTFVYRYLPATNRIAHRLMALEAPRRVVEELSERNLSNLGRVVRRVKPDLIICSYFFHSHCLARWKVRESLGWRLWSVVADPWTINPVTWVRGADLNLVYDEVGIREGEKMGIPKKKMMKTGWWTREQFFDKKLQITNNKLQIKRKLGFRDNRPIIFVGGGSLGTNALTRILPALMLVKKPVGLIINTGTDRLVFNLVEEYVRLLRKVKRDNLVQIKNLGWIEKMAEVLSACEIVFGKAGPNFIFDVVAAGKPLVAISHIGGQEDGNIDLIRKKKLGWIREKNGEIAKFMLEYLERPEWYNHRFDRTIRAEARRNRGSLALILREIQSLPKGELR